MSDGLAVFAGAQARALPGDAYGLAVLAAMERAETRLWCSMFLFSLDPEGDTRHTVRQLADALIRAHLRRVDVRLLLQRFVVAPDGFDANEATAVFLARRGVPVRRYGAPGGRASHGKTLVVDETAVIVGSGNFTPGAMDRNVELALEVRSADLNRDLAARFAAGWDAAEAI